jgi:hypothetical protein
LKRLNANPWAKYFPDKVFAIMKEQIKKIGSQKKNSYFMGMRNTVANAIANPKRDSVASSFQFIGFSLLFLVSGFWFLVSGFLFLVSGFENESY